MKEINLHHWLFFVVVILLILIVLIKSSDNAVADAPPATGTVCCNFDHNGVTKTCLAPDGQTCMVCEQVCDAQP